MDFAVILLRVVLWTALVVLGARLIQRLQPIVRNRALDLHVVPCSRRDFGDELAPSREDPLSRLATLVQEARTELRIRQRRFTTALCDYQEAIEPRSSAALLAGYTALVEEAHKMVQAQQAKTALVLENATRFKEGLAREIGRMVNEADPDNEAALAQAP